MEIKTEFPLHPDTTSPVEDFVDAYAREKCNGFMARLDEFEGWEANRLREVNELDYIGLSTLYAQRIIYNHFHFFLELGRITREGNDHNAAWERSKYMQQRGAASTYCRDPKNAKDLNPLTWVCAGEVGYQKDYQRDGHYYEDYDEGGSGAGMIEA